VDHLRKELAMETLMLMTVVVTIGLLWQKMPVPKRGLVRVRRR
jgi:hypothetical protein